MYFRGHLNTSYVDIKRNSIGICAEGRYNLNTSYVDIKLDCCINSRS